MAGGRQIHSKWSDAGKYPSAENQTVAGSRADAVFTLLVEWECKRGEGKAGKYQAGRHNEPVTPPVIVRAARHFGEYVYLLCGGESQTVIDLMFV